MHLPVFHMKIIKKLIYINTYTINYNLLPSLKLKFALHINLLVNNIFRPISSTQIRLKIGKANLHLL